MPTEHFRAGVQYGDWQGSAAADNAGERDIQDLLEEKKLIDRDHEVLVGIDLYVGENHGGKVEPPYLHAFVCEGKGADNVAMGLSKQADPIPVRRIKLDLTTQEFLGLFKRFNVVLTKRGLDLAGRQYQWDE